MGTGSKGSEGTNHSIILTGIAVCVFAWLIESIVDAYIFDGGSLFHDFFTPSAHELWMRIGFTAIVIVSSILIQAGYNRQKSSEKALKESEKRLRARLEFISSPDTSSDDISLADMLDLEELQRIQDTFSQACGCSSIIADIHGNPITRPSNFSKVCDIVRSTRKGAERCQASDRLRGERARLLMEPTYQECLSCGFVDASAPIIVAGKHIANWLIGQNNAMGVDRRRIEQIARDIGADVDEMLEAFDEMPCLPLDQFKLILNHLWEIAQKISTLSYNNLLLTRNAEELRRSEEKIQDTLGQTENSYRDLVEKAGIAILIDDHKGDFKYFNDTLASLFGYTRDEIKKKSVMSLIHPDDWARVSSYHERRFLDREVPTRYEFKGLKKDGTTLYLEVDVTVLEENGVVKKSRSYIWDITERVMADQALRESELRYHKMTSNVPGIVYQFVVHTDGSFSMPYASQGSKEMFGIHPSELMRDVNVLLDLIHPDDREKFRKDTEESARSLKPSRRELRGLHDGKERWFAANSRPERQPNGDVLFNGVLVEITERKLAEKELQKYRDHLEDLVRKRTEQIDSARRELEEDIGRRERTERALRESEEQYRTLFDQANDAIFLETENEEIIDVNQRACEMVGLTRDELLSRKTSDLVDVQSCEPQPTHEIYSQPGNSEGAMFEKTLVHSDGSLVPVEITLGELTAGGKRMFLSIVRDITDRKRAESEKRQFQEKLDRAERMESLGVLAGGVAHDLNNMLGPLVGYPELILRKLPEDSPVRKQVQRVGKAAMDAADVIQDLLTLARRGRCDLEPVSVNEVVESYVDSPSYSKLVERHPDVNVTINLDQSLKCINGSFPHLSKGIMNLIVNAFESMADGGELAIETSQQTIDRLLSGHNKIEPGEYILLRVRDTGSGISEEDLAKIFEPYYSKKKMGRSGSGLGLAVVYGVVKDHKGYYDVFSKKGEGTEFVLYFPTCPVALKREPVVEVDLAGNESVLVVDDVAEQREMASAMLASLGYKVTTASGGTEAVKYLTDHSVDIVMLDMIMEDDIDGLETYREILKLHPGQKAVVVSGFSQTDRVEEMQKLGAGQYIRKPYTITKIGKAIRDELGMHTEQTSHPTPQPN